MSKEKVKINFHGKIMNPFQAKWYVYGLRFGLVKPKLDDKEEQKYLELKYLEREREIAAERLLGKNAKKELGKKELKGKDYLIGLLKNIIIDAETLEKPEYCKKYGHIEEKSSAYTPKGIERAVTHYRCSNCGTVYEKKPDKSAYNPFSN
jgi:hypothetical protein